MTRSLTLFLLAAMLFTACGGAADTAITSDDDASEPTAAATATAAEADAAEDATDDATDATDDATDIDVEEAEAAAAIAGFCEDMNAWVVALQEYQQVEAGSAEEAAAVEEMRRLVPLINDRVEIPQLSEALEQVTAEAEAFVDGRDSTVDPEVMDAGAELISNLLTNC